MDCRNQDPPSVARPEAPPAAAFRVAGFAGYPAGWLIFDAPDRVVDAHTRDEIPAVLDALDAAVARDRYATVLLDYECAPVFDPAMRTRPAGAGPLARCATYATPPRWQPELN